ncbi:MAP7 domain-containing protein 1-like isoform X2 [Tribolium madens]|uniref:MAP7 domain-containing protein 1-like isoform X2 n=1 Tax=Tribolium madens TaxID=41895 RepID=UPI001CF736BB|nr:MAP7 domain-containing protein 1-like isoform X2 [Tribolium madens]
MVPEGINSDSLDYLRSILVKSLSSENVSKSDVLKVKQYKNNKKVHFNAKNVVDKEVRIKNLKEKQNEERQKRLEEMKAQAFAAQRFKEQKELERRKRLEELRCKEDVRRQQVEERKRAIAQADQDRLESILKRNQEREARIEAKKRNERSNIVFAFGSSTPRMLDPTDLTAFWGPRRATSIQNITCATSTQLTRRQSERDLDSGSKKRATSASGLERSGESTPLVPAGCASGYVGRRRTDLMPTIPSRDSPFAASRKSLNHSPGRAYSMSRLDQLAKPRKRPDLPAVVETTYSFRPLSSPRQSSVTRSMSHLAVSKTGPAQNRKPLNKSDSRSMHQLSIDGPTIAPRTTRATQLRQQKLLASSNCSEASSRPSSSLSQQSTTSVTSSVSVRHRPSTAPRRQRPASIAITGITHDVMKNTDNKKGDTKPPLPKTRKSINKDTKDKPTKRKSSPVDTPKSLASPVAAPNCNIPDNKTNDVLKIPPEPPTQSTEIQETKQEETAEKVPVENGKPATPNVKEVENSALTTEKPLDVSNSDQIKQITNELIKSESVGHHPQPESQPVPVVSETKPSEAPALENKENEMTTSVTKVRINTEEEAKAALAERRRLAREEAERQAEQERLRIEMEAQAELERQRREEEQIQRLIEAQRLAEQERLEEAIRETKKREEEERLRREEEQRSKLLKEEAEKKAREEAEKKFAEQQERLKNEEKEREARRKRVEAIMRRTRGVNNANSPGQQNSEDKNENKSENKMNGTQPVEQENGTGTKNGKDVDIVDNIIPDDTVKNANTVSIDTINSTDSINSNNTWQTTQQYDPLM